MILGDYLRAEREKMDHDPTPSELLALMIAWRVEYEETFPFAPMNEGV